MHDYIYVSFLGRVSSTTNTCFLKKSMHVWSTIYLSILTSSSACAHVRLVIAWLFCFLHALMLRNRCTLGNTWLQWQSYHWSGLCAPSKRAAWQCADPARHLSVSTPALWLQKTIKPISVSVWTRSTYRVLYGVFIAPCRSDLTLLFCDGASRPNSEVFVLRIVVMDSRQMLNRLAPRRMHHIVAASVLFARTANSNQVERSWSTDRFFCRQREN